MPVAVRFEGLTKTFGETRALDGVRLTIEPGELFFLLGPSGCGKTTLLRALAGFVQPDTGSVWIGDRDVTRVPPHQRDTGMVFQSYALWPHLSVRQNVAFGLEMRGLARDAIARRVEEALAMVRMTDRAGHKPNQLSGGQQQRVALARALVVQPQCLLLDEPLSNLDAKLRVEMRTEIRRICKEAELTAVYVTHDQKEALSIADRLAVMREGAILQCGPPRDVYLRPANRFVAHFIGETNFLDATVVEAGADGVRLRTALGPVLSRAVPPGGVGEGAEVVLSLRPEALRVSAPPPDAPNRFEGSVHHTVYLGEVAQHQVTVPRVAGLGDDLVFRAFELNPRIVARDEAEPVAVWFDPDDAVILAD